jgi:hypothetical protein
MTVNTINTYKIHVYEHARKIPRVWIPSQTLYLIVCCSLHINPLARSPGQVKLDSDK